MNITFRKPSSPLGVAVVATLGALGLGFGWLIGSRGFVDGSGASEPVVFGGGLAVAYFTPEERVASSQLIVIADFRSETTDSFEVPGPDAGAIRRTDLIRTFVVTESLRGAVAVGDELRVRWTTRLSFPPLDGSGSRPERSQPAPAVASSPQYVLFLSPADVAGEWFASGEPSLATLEADTLVFEASVAYRDSAQVNGVPVDSDGFPLALSGLTIETLRQLAAGPAGTSEPSTGTDPRNLGPALAIDKLIGELPELTTADEIQARAVELGYDEAARRSDPGYCRKAETAVRDLSGIDVSFDCPDS